MNNYPNDLPSQYKPLTAWQYFWLMVLYEIPVVGFVFLIIHSINGSNINRRSFARSFFCAYIIIAIIVAVIACTGGISAILSNLVK